VVAGGPGNEVMELCVVDYDGFFVADSHSHVFEDFVEFNELIASYSLGCHRGGGWFENPSHFEKLAQTILVHEIDRETDALEEKLGFQTGDIRAVAATYV
jgi:hypothetical protein